VGVPVNVGAFHGALDPYGEWTAVGDLGEPWRPTGVAPDRAQFDVEHWAWSEDGWR
jgi:hypothetical protein